MTGLHPSAALIVAVLGSACRAGAPEGDVGRVEAALMEADRAFARETAARGADGWVANFAEDGIMVYSGGTARGRAAIRETMARAFADTSFLLEWEPTEAQASAAGDLGYTVGRFRARRIGPDGGEVLRTGTYTTVWRRQADGRWRAVLDIGTEDPAP